MIVKKVKYLFEGYNLKIPKELDDLMLSEIQRHKGKWNRDDIKRYRAEVLSTYWANPSTPEGVRNIKGSGNALSKLQPALMQSIIADGEAWHKNKFLKVLANIPGTMTDLRDMDSKLDYVYQTSKKNNYDLNNSWYINRSLYDRDVDKFKYTVNAFETLSDRVKVRSYFDPDLVDMKKLYYNDGRTIKTATEIHDQIDEWEKQGGTKSNDYISLNDYLRNNPLKIPKNSGNKALHDLQKMNDEINRADLINEFLRDYAEKEYMKLDDKSLIINKIDKYVKKEMYLEQSLSSRTRTPESVARQVLQVISKL